MSAYPGYRLPLEWVPNLPLTSIRPLSTEIRKREAFRKDNFFLVSFLPE